MIRLSKPDIGIDELKEIEKVFESGYLVQGEMVELLEEKVKNYLNCKYSICVSSGTAALHLALMALDIKNDDEVIIPAFTFPATANVVEVSGAKVKLVDIDLDTFCICTEKLRNSITEKTKAIIPVHEFGYPINMIEMMKIAKEYNLYIIEDAACAFGAKVEDKYVGTFGNLGCFSLHPRKAITTGEGGIIVTDDEDIAKKIRALRNHGILYNEGRPQFVYAGLNYRLTNFQGAIGIVQFDKYSKIFEKRKYLVDLYNEKLNNLTFLKTPKEPEYGKHSWQTYHIILDDSVDQNDLITFLKTNNIETNYGANALHIEPYYKNKYNFNELEFPNALKAYKKGLALPLHPFLSDEDINYITNKLKEYAEKNL